MLFAVFDRSTQSTASPRLNSRLILLGLLIERNDGFPANLLYAEGKPLATGLTRFEDWDTVKILSFSAAKTGFGVVMVTHDRRSTGYRSPASSSITFPFICPFMRRLFRVSLCVSLEVKFIEQKHNMVKLEGLFEAQFFKRDRPEIAWASGLNFFKFLRACASGW